MQSRVLVSHQNDVILIRRYWVVPIWLTIVSTVTSALLAKSVIVRKIKKIGRSVIEWVWLNEWIKLFLFLEHKQNLHWFYVSECQDRIFGRTSKILVRRLVMISLGYDWEAKYVAPRYVRHCSYHFICIFLLETTSCFKLNRKRYRKDMTFWRLGIKLIFCSQSSFFYKSEFVFYNSL